MDEVLLSLNPQSFGSSDYSVYAGFGRLFFMVLFGSIVYGAIAATGARGWPAWSSAFIFPLWFFLIPSKFLAVMVLLYFLVARFADGLVTGMLYGVWARKLMNRFSLEGATGLAIVFSVMDLFTIYSIWAYISSAVGSFKLAGVLPPFNLNVGTRSAFAALCLFGLAFVPDLPPSGIRSLLLSIFPMMFVFGFVCGYSTGEFPRALQERR